MGWYGDCGISWLDSTDFVDCFDRLPACGGHTCSVTPLCVSGAPAFPGAEFGCGFSGSLGGGFGCTVQAKTCSSLSRVLSRAWNVARACSGAYAWLGAVVAGCGCDGNEWAGVGAGAGGRCDSGARFGGVRVVLASTSATLRGWGCAGASDVAGPRGGTRCGCR